MRKKPGALDPAPRVRDFTFKGFAIPADAGRHQSLLRIICRRSGPTRKNSIRCALRGSAAQPPPLRLVPFGGGAHMCLGLHFAYMQAKTLPGIFCKTRVSLEPGYSRLADVADPETRDGLRVVIKRCEISSPRRACGRGLGEGISRIRLAVSPLTGSHLRCDPTSPARGAR